MTLEPFKYCSTAFKLILKAIEQRETHGLNPNQVVLTCNDHPLYLNLSRKDLDDRDLDGNSCLLKDLLDHFRSVLGRCQAVGAGAAAVSFSTLAFASSNSFFAKAFLSL